MRHYNPRFVYVLPTFWKSKTFFQGVFFRKFCPYVWLVFKSGFWSRAVYSGTCTVIFPKYFISIHFEAQKVKFSYLIFSKITAKTFHQLWPNTQKALGPTTSRGFIEVNNCLIWCSTAHKPFRRLLSITPSLLNWRTLQWFGSFFEDWTKLKITSDINLPVHVASASSNVDGFDPSFQKNWLVFNLFHPLVR